MFGSSLITGRRVLLAVSEPGVSQYRIYLVAGRQPLVGEVCVYPQTVGTVDNAVHILTTEHSRDHQHDVPDNRELIDGIR